MKTPSPLIKLLTALGIRRKRRAKVLYIDRGGRGLT
jgi:hypothetical protein